VIHQKRQPAVRAYLLAGFFFVCAAFLPGAAWAGVNVYGSNPNTNLGTLDTCSGCLFAYVDFPGSAAGSTVLSYQFYNAAGASNYLTPVLLEQNSTTPRTFKIIGIGDASTGFVPGYNSINFVLAGGSATVLDSHTFFGYVDGTVSSSGQITGNTGTIPSNYPNGPGAPGYFAGLFSPVTVQVGNTFATDEWVDVGQQNRTYSLLVTTTPEPGFYGLLSLGLGGVLVGLTGRRRRA
jgi:hypothetical protein